MNPNKTFKMLGAAVAAIAFVVVGQTLAQLPADDADSSFSGGSFMGNNGGLGFATWAFLEPAGTSGSSFQPNSGAQVEGGRSWGIAAGSGGIQGYATRRLLSTPLITGTVTLRMRHNVNNLAGFSGFNLRQADLGTFGNQELLSIGLRPFNGSQFGDNCVAVGGSVDKQICLGVDLRGRRLEYRVTWDTVAGLYTVFVRDIDNPSIHGAISGCLKFTTGIGVQSLGFGNFNGGVAQDLIFDTIQVKWNGPVYEDFAANATFTSPYTAGGAIGGKNGGLGFSAAWSTATSPSGLGGGTTVSPGLTKDLLTEAGFKARIAVSGADPQNSGRANFHSIHRFFDQSTAAGDGNHTVWLSFLVRKESGVDANTYGGLSLFDNSTTAERLFIGKRFGSSTWGIERANYAPTQAGDSGKTVDGTTRLVVVRIDANSGPDNDIIRLFVDPCLTGSETEPANGSADVTLGPLAGFDFNFDRIRIAAGNGNNTQNSLELQFDEIRIGRNFAEVVPTAISGSDAVCQQSLVTFSAPAGATAFSWSLLNDSSGSSVLGSTSGSSVNVLAGTSGGAYRLDLRATAANGCIYQATKTVKVSDDAPCSINGPAAVCAGTQNGYTSVIAVCPNPPYSYSWSISGNGTIVGSTSGSSVTVDAGATGSYTLTLSLTESASGASCSCTYTVNIDGEAPSLSCSAPALLNASFENGGPNFSQIIDNWQIFGNGYHETVAPRTGSFFAKTFGNWGGNPDYTGLFQDLPAAPGQTWRASVYAMLPSWDLVQNGSYGKLNIEFFNGSTFLGSQESQHLTIADPKDTYIKLKVTAVAPAGTTKVRIVPTFVQLGFGGGAVYFDDASLTRITTVSADSSCQGLIPDVTSLATVSDASAFTLSQSPAAGTPVGLGDHPVTITAVDACGNSSQCGVTVTVVDDTAPTISCPANTTIECDASAAPANTGSPSVADTCPGIVSTFFSDATAPGSCGSASVITRTWYAVDASGNLSAPCVQTITRQDTTAPALVGVPANAAVACATDIPAAPSPARAWGLYANSSAGSEAIRPFNAPLAVGQKFSVDLDTGFIDAGGTVGFVLRSGNGSRLEVYYVGGGAFYVVDGTTANASAIPYTGEGVHVDVTLTGPDTYSVTLTRLQNGQTQTVTGSLDGTPGSSIDNIRFFNFNAGMGGANDAFYNNLSVAGVAYDNAAAAAYDDGWQNGDNGGSGFGPWTLTGFNGTEPNNYGRFIGNSTANDGGDSNGDGDINALAVTAADNCDPHVNVSYSQTDNGATGCNGSPRVITRTWTATDDCGNTASQTQTITQEDTTGPVLTGVPADAAVQCPTDVLQPSAVTATDDCSGNATVLFTEAQVVNVITRTWSATDACGNTTTQSQTITIDDTQAPVITCPADVTVVCPASTEPSNTGSATATDNCDLDIPQNPTFLFKFGSRGSGPGQFGNDPVGIVASSDHRIFVGDDYNNRVEVFDQNGNFLFQFGSGGTGDGQFNRPAEMAIDNSDRIYIADRDNNRVQVFDPDGNFLFKFGSGGSGNGQFANVDGVGVNRATGRIYVADRFNHRVQVFDPAGNFLFKFGTPGSADGQLLGPGSVRVNSLGNIFVAELGIDRVSVFDPSGNFLFKMTGMWFPRDIQIDRFDRVYVADAHGRVQIYDRDGNLLTQFGTSGSGNGQFGYPVGIEVDAGGRIYVSDGGNARVQVFTPFAAAVAIDHTDSINGACPKVISRTWTATDSHGNSSSCTQTITSVDTTAPVLSGQGANATIQCPAVPSFTAPSASDSCDASPTVTFSDVATPGSCPNAYSVTRTWVAEDDCGNQSDAVSQTITVVDTTAPTIVINQPLAITAQCDAVPGEALASVTDNCDSFVADKSMSESTTPGSCPGNYTITRIWTATDSCGNSASITQVITIVDTIAPVLAGVPANATIECPATPVFTAPTASDNCDAVPSISFADVTTPGSCAGSYSVTRTWTAEDDCGNVSAPASQTITVVDTNAPSIAAAMAGPNALQNAGFEAGGPAGSQAISGWSIFGNAYHEPFSPHTGVYVAKTFGNWLGNPDYTGVFQDAPAAAGQLWRASVYAMLPSGDAITNGSHGKLRIEFLGAGDFIIGGVDSAPIGLSDPYDVYLQLTVSAVAPAGTLKVRIVPTFVQLDLGSGAVYFDDASLQQIDTSITVQCPGDVPAPDTSLVVGSDSCGGAVTITHEGDTSNGGTGCAGDPIVITRTFRATDACGNSSDATVTINVADTIAPVLAGVPADATVECSAVPAAAVVTASDNCDAHVAVAMTESQTTGTCASGYIITRTWTATDDCGNSSSASQVITVQDTTAPYISANWLLNAGFEYGNGPGGQIINSWTSFGPGTYHEPFAPHSGTFHAKVFGGGGNNPDYAGWYQDVPAAAGQAWRASVYAYLPSSDSIAANDNYAKVRIEFFDASHVFLDGQDSVFLDGSSPQDQHILLSVTMVAPVNAAYVRIVPTFVQIDGASGAVYFDDARLERVSAYQCATEVPAPDASLLLVEDNCDASPAVTHLGDTSTGSGCSADPLVITRSFVATDGCGNSNTGSIAITVADTIAPVLAGIPADATAECGAVPAPAAVTATDNCATNVAIAVNDVVTAGACEGSYTITRTWTATDDCGNSSSASQVITVQDTTAPALAGVPADATVQCDAIPAAAAVTASDACDSSVTAVLSESSAAGTCPGSYTITRVWTANDDCGNNSSATQVITVVDTTAPVLSGQGANVTIECPATPSFTAPTASDNCDAAPSIVFNDVTTTGGCAGSYSVTRTWTATDNCDNESLPVSQTITVVDTTDPILVGVPANTTAECSAIPGAASVSATDNCDNDVAVAFNESQSAAACEGSYVITRTWTATDDCGNSSSASQVITVQDTTGPALLGVPADTTAECSAIPAAASVSASDNCDTSVSVGMTESTTPGSCANSYTITRTWTATDDCGNSSIASQTITVQDTVAPVLSGVPADTTASCDAIPAAATVTASDACDSSVAVSLSETTTAGSCPGNYTITRTWTATDDCGNSSSATQVVTVADTTAPTLSGQGADATIECPAVPSFTAPSASDNCDAAPSISYSDVTTLGACAGAYSVTRTWIAEDACGNDSAPVSQTITVVDTTAPVITCPASQTIVQSNCASGVVFTQPTATDGCDANVTVTCVPPSGSLLGPGAHTIVATATDDCGNSSTCSFTVNVRTRLHVVFDPSPVNDDNVDDNIETDQDIKNKFKAGSRIPHKIKLYDCAGNDVTLAVAPQVTVKLNVTLREYINLTTSVLVVDVPEVYTGVGSAGGVMVVTGGFFHYNLNTTGYPAGTDGNSTFFRSHVTVEYNTAPGTVVGEEDALLESK